MFILNKIRYIHPVAHDNIIFYFMVYDTKKVADPCFILNINVLFLNAIFFYFT